MGWIGGKFEESGGFDSRVGSGRFRSPLRRIEVFMLFSWFVHAVSMLYLCFMWINAPSFFLMAIGFCWRYGA